VQETFNEMDDSEAECPLCGFDADSVKSAIYHANQKHDGDWNRKATCQQCGDCFTPSNWHNTNKYCSEECFGKSDSGGRPHKGWITYVCYRDDCNQENTVQKSIYDLMNDEPACSIECRPPRKEEHPNWQGGSEKIRQTYEYSQWTKAVHDSGDVCASCGASENLSAHHIIPISVEPDKALMPSNGRLLCGECHAERHPDMAKELFT
jgi:5-methylcytosine-specific restriction endonuclease McrA